MKRVIYSIPLFFLLLPWMFISMVILGVGFFGTPFSLLLLLPMTAVLAAAFHVHHVRTKLGQHGIAAIGASAVLAAPLVAIVVAFFTCGQDIAREQARDMGLSAGYQSYAGANAAAMPTPKEDTGCVF